MKTLYDLLGTRPDDDAEALKAAFRKAAKANHPDLHAGDRMLHYALDIAEAYEILRDAEQRATYDRLLRFERERLRWTLKSSVSYLMHSIASDTITAAGLAIILAGGYMTYAHFSKIPAEARAPEPITSGPVPKAAALNSDVKTTSAFAVIIDQAGPKSVEERPDQSAGTEMLDREGAQLVKVLSSSEESDGVGKSSPADLATSDLSAYINQTGRRGLVLNRRRRWRRCRAGLWAGFSSQRIRTMPPEWSCRDCPGSAGCR
jgi:curved DNA-binding protein CbpA